LDRGRIPPIEHPGFQLDLRLFLGFLETIAPLRLTTPVGFAQASGKDLDKRAEGAFGVRDDAQVHGKDLADFPGIFFNMDAAGLRLDRRLGEVAIFPDQATADGKNQNRLSPHRKFEAYLTLRNLKAIRVVRRKAEKR